MPQRSRRRIAPDASTRPCRVGAAFVCAVVLLAAPPVLGQETPSEDRAAGTASAPASAPETNPGPGYSDAALMRTTAAALAARTQRRVDLIVRGQTVQLMENLTRDDDKSAKVGDEISRRINARLSEAMTQLRGNGFALATNRNSDRP